MTNLLERISKDLIKILILINHLLIIKYNAIDIPGKEVKNGFEPAYNFIERKGAHK